MDDYGYGNIRQGSGDGQMDNQTPGHGQDLQNQQAHQQYQQQQKQQQQVRDQQVQQHAQQRSQQDLSRFQDSDPVGQVCGRVKSGELTAEQGLLYIQAAKGCDSGKGKGSKLSVTY